MTLHKNVPIASGHKSHAWEYADAAARTGAVGMTPADVGKLALQLDDWSLWILTDDAPLTWAAAGAGAGTYTNATPMPEDVGGWEAGTTFAGKTVTEMFTGLLYPYQYPAFSAFAIAAQATPLEVGAAIATNRTFTWTTTNPTNVAPNSIALYDVTGAATIATGLADDGSQATAYPAVPIMKTSATTNVFRVTGTDTLTNVFQRDYTVAWQWTQYYGESVDAGPLAESDIEALRASALAPGFAGTYAFVGGGYKYLAYAAVLGTAATFKDASTGLDVPFEALYTVSVTNANGQTTNYNVHRSTNIIGAAIDIVVS
jgi:hypothetical protein